MENKFVITFAFEGDEGYTVQKSKPIPATDEQDACQILINARWFERPTVRTSG